MLTIAAKLTAVINVAKPRLQSIPEVRATDKPYPDKWSIKEILGHLVDSASTNHQRIVRMQASPDIGALSYEQMHWVASQSYRTEPWGDLVGFWSHYNHHLAHVIRHINPKMLDNVCDIDYGAPVTLRFVAEDYLRHTEHHLDQIFSGADPRMRKKWMA